jgi:RNA polymerase sigma factor (sigma-70 family)
LTLAAANRPGPGTLAPHPIAGGAGVAVRSLEDARDRDLLRRIGEGDEDAFRDLFRRYGPAGKALALRIIRQPLLAEEVLQEAFLALWRNPGAYREDRGTVRGWLMSAVHHRAVDFVRREEAQRRRSEEMEAEAAGAVTQDVAEAVVDDADVASRRAGVRAALEEIPGEQRRVLELMYYEGKTQAMIAQDLGLPLGTVKSRTLLGMRRLRAMLTEANG